MRDYRSKPTPDASITEAALDAMDAAELRSLVRDTLPWFDDILRARFTNELVDRAARNLTGWVPESPDTATVREIEAFVETAKRVGYADPMEVDAYLRLGSNAFLAKNYPAAFRIFRSLLMAVGHGHVDMGQEELIDDVLGVDSATCAAQYVLSMYMTADPKLRGKAVLSAIDEMHGIENFWRPLHTLEQVAVEPLPDFDDFVEQWRALVEERAAKPNDRDWDRDVDRWLREAVQRTEGPDGLAKVARASRRADDLRAWCDAVFKTGDWAEALAAYAEAAELVSDKEYARGSFLDGAALAAQELRRGDLPDMLERAWLKAPTMTRLCRWLGSSVTRDVVQGRVDDALDACPKAAHRQRALLLVLRGEITAAAKLLADAPGLGWSSGEHPGHLLFPVFTSLLSQRELQKDLPRDYDDLGLSSGDNTPKLTTPTLRHLMSLAVPPRPDANARASVLKAMRAAAEKRVSGVTENKRRRHYGHAASLVACCAELDRSANTTTWVMSIRSEYRRYPALQGELDSHLAAVR